MSGTCLVVAVKPPPCVACKTAHTWLGQWLTAQDSCRVRRAGGHIPPFQVYPSGALYHTSCAVQRLLLLSSDAAYKQQLNAALKVLAAVPRQGRRNAENVDKVDAAQSELALLLKEGDPFNSERVLMLAALPYPDKAEDWRIEGT